MAKRKPTKKETPKVRSLRGLANALRTDTSTLKRAIEDHASEPGLPVQDSHGEYDIEEWRAWYATVRRPASGGRPAAVDVSSEDKKEVAKYAAKRARLEYEDAEIESMAKRGKYVLKEVVLQEATKATLEVRQERERRFISEASEIMLLPELTQDGIVTVLRESWEACLAAYQRILQ